MKKVIMLIFPLVLSSGGVSNLDKNPKHNIVNPTILQPAGILPTPPIEKLINALIYVESRGKSNAVGDTHLGEPSIGVLQIRPIMVREVNRILKISHIPKRFKLKDRFNREKSIAMFMVWKNYHHPKGGFETIARNWNGGPKGYRYNRTIKYWVKVQKQLQ